MIGVFGQPGYVPSAAPLDFERLFVGGTEIKPGETGGSVQIANVKPISIKGDIDATAVARAFNQLIAELKAAGIMSDK